MIRTRLALLVWSALAVFIVAISTGWVVGALIVGWFMVIAPGGAVIKMLGLQRDGDWITVVAVSLAIDTLGTEAMVYAHVWTPLRGVLALAAFTATVVVVDERLSRS